MNSPSSNDESGEENLPISFDIFSKQYNNFLLYFYRHLADSYRKTKHFIRFQQENLALEEELTKLFSDVVKQWNPNEEQNLRLYEAYKIMKKYWYSDRELFS